MPAGLQFCTFVATYGVVLNNGMQNAHPVCKSKAIRTDVQMYSQRHDRDPAPYTLQVHATFSYPS